MTSGSGDALPVEVWLRVIEAAEHIRDRLMLKARIIVAVPLMARFFRDNPFPRGIEELESRTGCNAPMLQQIDRLTTMTTFCRRGYCGCMDTNYRVTYSDSVYATRGYFGTSIFSARSNGYFFVLRGTKEEIPDRYYMIDGRRLCRELEPWTRSHIERQRRVAAESIAPIKCNS